MGPRQIWLICLARCEDFPAFVTFFICHDSSSVKKKKFLAGPMKLTLSFASWQSRMCVATGGVLESFVPAPGRSSWSCSGLTFSTFDGITGCGPFVFVL